VSDLLGLLGVEQERLAALRPPQHDADPPATAVGLRVSWRRAGTAMSAAPCWSQPGSVRPRARA